MDWNARSAWIYRDTVPDVDKAIAHSIKIIYIDPRSANDIGARDAIRAKGLIAGIYVSTSWYASVISPEGFALAASNLANSLLPKTGIEAPPIMLDMEVGSAVLWADNALQAYRSHQPHRPTAYTNAPFQGGYVPSTLLSRLGIHSYPQLYYGDTLPDGRLRPADPAAVLMEAVRSGMPASMVHPFYDGAVLPTDARDGCVFTLERLQ